MRNCRYLMRGGISKTGQVGAPRIESVRTLKEFNRTGHNKLTKRKMIKKSVLDREEQPIATQNEPSIGPRFTPEFSRTIEVSKGFNLFEEGSGDLLKGIILAEVLGKPRCRRRGSR